MEERTIGTESAPDTADHDERGGVPARTLSVADTSLDASSESAEAGDCELPSASSHRWAQWIRQGSRAATLRSVQGLPDGPGPWTMLLVVFAAIVIVTGASRFEVNGPASFDFRSWLFGWAPSALLIFGVWFILNLARERNAHSSPVAAWYLLFYVATLPTTLVGIAIGALVVRGQMSLWSEGSWLAWVIYAVLWIWMLIAAWRVSQAVTRSKLAIASMVLCVFVVQALGSWQLQTQPWRLSDYPEGDDFASLELSQEVFESQQKLLKDSLLGIAPSTSSERQVYGLIYAPYSEDVFLRESAMVQDVLEARFDARGRVIRLLNNPNTTEAIPWATPLNLQRSLKALADAMNRERDVLMVYLTSHGGADFKLAAEHWPLEVAELTGHELRTLLDGLGIRHRVIAVSACYSGGWIEALQGDDTLVMTAADKNHTSYGCGSKSELTFFGRAVFDEQLRKASSFEEAFNSAVPVIKQREIDAKKDDGFSNPQISVGRNIRTVLGELRMVDVSR